MFPTEKYVVNIKQSGKISNYVAYAEGQLKEECGGRVELVAKGKGIEKAISVSEILKRNHTSLHQQSTLRSEGDERGRPVPCVKIVLAIRAEGVDIGAPGYTAPQGLAMASVQSSDGLTLPQPVSLLVRKGKEQ